ncbi:MAG: tetratricopeptide repeat protein [Steroidobacteraceae bacterium]
MNTTSNAIRILARTVGIVFLGLVGASLSGCDLFVSPAVRIERASKLIEAGDYRAADIELRNALRKDPDNVRARTLMARTAYWRGDTVGANVELERALSLGVAPASVGRLRADILRALGKYPELATLSEDPASGLSAYERPMFRGYAELGQGDASTALASFAVAVDAARGESLAEALTAQAVGHVAIGDVEAALAAFERALSIDPAYLPALVARANLWLRSGDFPLAESSLAQVTKLPSFGSQPVADRVASFDVLCESQLGQGRYADARQTLRQLDRLVPGSPLVAYLGGRIDLATGKTAEAISQLERAVQGAPDFHQARMVLGLAQLEQGNFALAENELQRVVNAAPDNVEARQLLAQAQLRQGRVDAAATVLEPALEAAARQGLPSLLDLGRLELQAGRGETARQAFERALAADPKNGAAYLGLASLAETKGDVESARLWLERWRAADAAAAQPRLLLARGAFKARDPVAGHAMLAEAVGSAPGSATVAAAAGFVLMEARLYDEALGQFRRAATTDPRDPVYPLQTARAQLALGQGAAARQSLERALVLKPDWPPAVLLLVQVDLRERRVQSALARAAALQKNPDSAAIGYLVQGDILLSTGQAKGAEAAYAESARRRASLEAAVGQGRARLAAGAARPAEPIEAWVRAHPADAGGRLALAQVYQATGSPAAVAEYEQVLELRPGTLVALNNLAWLYGERGDSRAVGVARQAVAAAPGVGSIVDTLGWILVQQGQLDEGLKYVQQAHDLDRENPEIAYHLGVALLKAGRKAEAKVALDQAISGGAGAPWVAAARAARAEAGT